VGGPEQNSKITYTGNDLIVFLNDVFYVSLSVQFCHRETIGWRVPVEIASCQLVERGFFFAPSIALRQDDSCR